MKKKFKFATPSENFCFGVGTVTAALMVHYSPNGWIGNLVGGIILMVFALFQRARDDDN